MPISTFGSTAQHPGSVDAVYAQWSLFRFWRLSLTSSAAIPAFSSDVCDGEVRVVVRFRPLGLLSKNGLVVQWSLRVWRKITKLEKFVNVVSSAVECSGLSPELWQDVWLWKKSPALLPHPA